MDASTELSSERQEAPFKTNLAELLGAPVEKSLKASCEQRGRELRRGTQERGSWGGRPRRRGAEEGGPGGGELRKEAQEEGCFDMCAEGDLLSFLLYDSLC